TPEWIGAQYPDAQIFLTEFGMLYDKNNPGSPDWTDEQRIDWLMKFAPRCTVNPQIAKMFYFIPLGTPDQSQHFLDTPAEKNAMRMMCDGWRAARAWPRGAVAPPVVPAEPANYDTEHLRIVRALNERIRQRVEIASAALGGIDSDAQEAIDRLAMAGLDRPFP
ncbi:MAG: hypothetical protein WC718_16840, partial [Phycisphaerales bacterium]